MQEHFVRFVDPCGATIAIARVVNEVNYFDGTIDIDQMPPNLRSLFIEFEEIVNTQMFSLLDDVQQRIASFRIAASFDSGPVVAISDLHFYPGTGSLAFRVTPVSA